MEPTRFANSLARLQKITTSPILPFSFPARASEFYFKLFGIIYGLDGVTGFLFGQGYLDCGIFIFGYTPLDWKLKFFANIPHIAIGGIAVFIGFVLSKRFVEYAQA